MNSLFEHPDISSLISVISYGCMTVDRPTRSLNERVALLATINRP